MVDVEAGPASTRVLASAVTVAELVSTLRTTGTVSPLLAKHPIFVRALSILDKGPVDWATSAAMNCAQLLWDTEGAPPPPVGIDQLRRGAEALILDVLMELSGAPSSFDLCRPIHQETIHEIAARDVPMHVAVEGLRFAQQFFMAELLAHAAAFSTSPALINDLTMRLSRCIDRFIDSQIKEYAEVREQLARSGGALTLQIIDALVNGREIDPVMARQRLGLDLTRPHVACVLRVRKGSFTTGEVLQGALNSVVRVFGSSPELRYERPYGEFWVWFTRSRIDRKLAARIYELSTKDVLIALGSPQPGPEGIRRSLIEAQDALRVADATGTAVAVRYEDVALVALMSHDLERCRWFVNTTLGPLAGRGKDMRELRETLAQYFVNGQRLMSAASALHLHRNTLAHRLERIARLLGHPASDHTAAVHAALVLRDVLGEAVLPSEPMR